MFDILDGNYKGRLLEISAKFFDVLVPEFLHFEYGPAHAKVFLCICTFKQLTSSSKGRTKIEAEQFASRVMLKNIQHKYFEKQNTQWVLSSPAGKNILSQEIQDLLGELIIDPRADIFSLYGNAVLRYFIVKYLFDHYSEFHEGVLTRIVSAALKDKTRAKIADTFNLEKYIRTESTPHVLAETLSIIIGKLALLKDESFSWQLIMMSYCSLLDRFVAKILSTSTSKNEIISISHIETQIHNFKNELQEIAQKNHCRLPIYTLLEKIGDDHDPIFHHIINHYRVLSGIPLIINTIFNMHEEPIVCTPQDAIKAFLQNCVNVLAIKNFWIKK